MSSPFLQTFRLGVKSLLLQKLRASLAALGIFIGTTTVIWLVAVGEGISYQAQQQIKDLGATNIIVRSIAPSDGGESGDNERVKRYGLPRADYDRMLSNVPTIKDSVPMRELRRSIIVGDRNADAKLVGCTEGYLGLNQLAIARGRWFNERDERENVIVLAAGTAKLLFPYEDPVDRSVWVGEDLYRVIGQTKSRLPSAAIGGSLESRDYNLDAYIPLSTLRSRVGDFIMERRPGSFTGEIVELSQITLTVDSIEEVDVTASIVEWLLGKFHENEDYAVIVPKELLRQAERTRAMFNVLLVVIAGISLIVGGIGIMNIMLATVTERTREIGIRRALGARRSHIVQQFLVETVVLTASGGLLGVAFGFLCGPLFKGGRYLAQLAAPQSIPDIVATLEPRIAPWSVLLALFISIGVGLLFGVYPARKAALMHPIEALRHE